jgi:hypothetical protein
MLAVSSFQSSLKADLIQIRSFYKLNSINNFVSYDNISDKIDYTHSFYDTYTVRLIEVEWCEIC